MTHCASSRESVGELERGPTPAYHTEYERVNAQLERLAATCARKGKAKLSAGSRGADGCNGRGILT
jgi:hypothetical protein